jgi:hypothetical protein
MVRPGVPDPRDPYAPIRYDDEAMDKRRAQVTVGQLMQGAPNPPIPYAPLDLPDIEPGRLQELRRRRDYLIPLIREWLGGRQ